MNIRSAKAKGRRLAQFAKDIMLKFAPSLEEDDIRVTPASVPGEDLQMSPLAKKTYPYSVECKNHERLNIWKAYEQSESNTKEHETAIVVFTKNRAKVLVCLEFEAFLKLTRPEQSQQSLEKDQD